MNIRGPKRRNPSAPPPPSNARRRTLAAWRGVDVAPLEIARALTARSSSQVLPRVLENMRLDRRRSETEIVKVWNNLIDPNLIAHAQPSGLRNGTLFVTVDSSVWLDEIVRYRRREILERLQHSFGRETIARISFRVG